MRLSLAMAEKPTEELSRICSEMCGAKCCRTTNIALRAVEVETLNRLAQEKDMGVALRRDANGAYLRSEDQQGKQCPFLEDPTSRCSIYEERPNACRSFPDGPELDGCLLSGWAPKPKVVIASVHGKDVPYQHLAMRDLIGHNLASKGLWGGKVTSSSVRVDQNRNECVDAFLQTDANYLLFIDDDQGFPPQVGERLMKADAAIVCGVYFQRDPDDPYPHVYRYAGRGKGQRYDQEGELFVPLREEVYDTVKDLPLTDKPVLNQGEGPYLECDAGGTGCVLIHRSVFETMPAPWFHTEGCTNGDMQFFYKAKQIHGFKIIADLGLISSHYRWAPLGVGTFITHMRGVGSGVHGETVNSQEYWDNLHRSEYGVRRTYGLGWRGIVTFIAQSFFPREPIIVADFGCGWTDIHEALHEARNCSIVGIDFAKSAQEENRQRMPLDFWPVWDVTKPTPLNDGHAELVISNSVIEHLEDPRSMLDEMWRVTKPGGLMVLGIPLYLPHPEHVAIYTWDSVMKLASCYGSPVHAYPLEGRAVVAIEKPLPVIPISQELDATVAEAIHA